MTVLPLLVLIPLTLFPAFSGLADAIFALGALFAAIRFSLSRICARAEKVESTRKTIAACIDRICPGRVRSINDR